MVRCTRRRWLAASLLACRLMPVDAASLMMATSLRPAMNRSRSRTGAAAEVGEGRGLVYSTCVRRGHAIWLPTEWAHRMPSQAKLPDCHIAQLHNTPSPTVE